MGNKIPECIESCHGDEMDFVEVTLNILLAFIKILIGVILAVVAVNIGLVLFEKITQMGKMGELDILKELENGNAAVAILMIGVVLAIAIVIRSGIYSLTEIPGFDWIYVWNVVWGFAQMLLSIVLSIVAIYLALWVLKRFMEGKDIIGDIKEGNIAMGIVIAGIVISIALIIEISVSGITPPLPT
jgi:uncharacterized membrane protein YjfL (UPF0719 family)